jgi:general secretion pathway protein E
MAEQASLRGEQILHELEQRCTQLGASDIHASPEKDGVRLEIRLNGMLETEKVLSHDDYDAFLRRIKFVSKLKLNLTNVPQDGQYTFNAGDREVNVRVATIPSRFGESITLRLLDPKRGIVTLEQLGFTEEMHQKLSAITHLPYGLFLVTGPTGSGKTTTLYALLKELVGTKRHIITLEDPVEYEIKGIVQSEIDPDHGYSFAGGLRSILRHDPNVILVGEIRDLETAQTAVDAALTGHLVLSTLHTNSALEAIPRLLSMGVSPYTFAPALRGVMAQRLVRKVSDAAKAAGAVDPANPATYDGRTVIAEVLTVSPKIRDLILAQADETELAQAAAAEGYVNMRQFGENLVAQGVTTIQEVERVTR